MKKGLVAIAVVTASVLAPAASASTASGVHLSLIPLPMSALGSAAHGLALGHASGVISNLGAADDSFSGSPATFKKLGRITGYALGYGNEESGLPGVNSVWTNIDEYKNAKDAKRGLAFWKKDDRFVSELNQDGFAVTNALVKVPAVGSSHFADLTSYSASNIAPVSSLDEAFVRGRYQLDVTVSAGSAAQAKTLAIAYSKKLDARLKLALDGRLHGKAVKLPPKQQAGPPPGGPDLAATALATSDFTGQASIIGEDYFADPWAVSDYSLLMVPAGPFAFLGQDIEWYATANQASFETDRTIASEESVGGAAPLDLSSLGDGARAVVVNDSTGGEAQIVFSTGQLAEFIFVGSDSAVQGSAVTNLAQTAANKIDAALGS